MTVNKRYFRVFLIFLILFGAYQMYEINTLQDPGVSEIVITGAMMLIGVVIVSAIWFLKNIR